MSDPQADLDELGSRALGGLLVLVNIHQQPGGSGASKHHGHPRAVAERSKQAALRAEARQAAHPKLDRSWLRAIGGSRRERVPSQVSFSSRKTGPRSKLRWGSSS